MTNHSPAPWHEKDCYIHDVNGLIVAALFSDDQENVQLCAPSVAVKEANKALILAAPGMLAQMEDINAIVSGILEREPPHDQDALFRDIKAIRDAACEAIQAAEELPET